MRISVVKIGALVVISLLSGIKGHMTLTAAERATVHFDNPNAKVHKASAFLVSVQQNEIAAKRLSKGKPGEQEVFVLDRATILSHDGEFCNWDDLPDPSAKTYVARLEWIEEKGERRLLVAAVSEFNPEAAKKYDIMQPLPDEGPPASLEELK